MQITLTVNIKGGIPELRGYSKQVGITSEYICMNLFLAASSSRRIAMKKVLIIFFSQKSSNMRVAEAITPGSKG
jgi:hypothetical protein